MRLRFWANYLSDYSQIDAYSIVTGSAVLIGSETVRRFAKKEGARLVGIDNDMRARFFGKEASTKKTRDDLIANVPRYEIVTSIFETRMRLRAYFNAIAARSMRLCIRHHNHRMTGRLAIRILILRSMQMAR
jgi:NAD(P)-dependent dehydrogenase (short-subunit alcohol dehydrogenase family)